MTTEHTEWYPADAAASLRELAIARGSVVLPSQEFFRPTENFWLGLASIIPPGVKLIDCGTGMGHVPKAARERGVDIDGVDLLRREGQDPSTLLMDALDIHWSPRIWPLLCRPSHGAMPHTVASSALRAGAGCLYAGLPKNLRRDLGKSARLLKRAAGEDGESLYYLCPAQTTVHMSRASRS